MFGANASGSLSTTKLLATIRPSDVDPDAPDFDPSSFRPRTAARAVLFDGDKVALIHVSADGYYMLPGGGIDGDDMATGLAREIQEELGCRVTIAGEVGSVTIYNDRWASKQTDYCYIAHKTGQDGAASLTDFETESGYQVVWAADINEAIQLVQNARPQMRDGKLIQARDLLFLQTAHDILAGKAVKTR